MQYATVYKSLLINIKNMTEKNEFANYKEESLTRPRDKAWDNWKSWKDAKIGDKIQGYVADAFYRPEELDSDGSVAFRPQRGITLKQTDGTFVNVGIKDIDFVLSATDNLRVGDPLTIEFTEQREGSKGKAGAKIYSYYGKNLPDTEGQPTVKKLTDEDRIAGGSSAPEEENELLKDDETLEKEVTDNF